MADAACGGMESDIFFNEERVDEAKAICRKCLVRKECRDFSFEQRLYEDHDGVYAGLLPQNRRSASRMERKRETERKEHQGVVLL